ncbi:MAG: class I SAM-dependent methyltransferase, partial [Nitrospirota bacterium]
REAGSYDSMRWLTRAGKLINSVQIEIMEDFIKDLSHGDFLEVASGTGRFTKVLLEKNFSVTSIDISSSMLEQLKQKLKDHPNIKNHKMLVSDARDMELKSSTFDGVVCFNALSHIPEHKRVLKEVYRVLKPGGRFIFNIPNYLSVYLPFGLYVNLRKKSITRDVYTRWYTFNEIKNDLEELGFSIEKVKGQFHFPTSTPSFLLPFLKNIDRGLRNGFMVKLSPVLFIEARKV